MAITRTLILNAVLLRRRDADAGIRHAEDRLAVLLRRADGHAAALAVILDGIVAEIVDQLVHDLRNAVPRRGVRKQNEPLRFCRSGFLHTNVGAMRCLAGGGMQK